MAAKLKIAVLGSEQTGKSAIVVRYLTRRYISEYSSQSDFLYRHTVLLDENMEIEVDILDTSGRLDTADLLEYIDWANGIVIVYSLSDSNSFPYACQLLESISLLKSSHCPVALLANKTDISYARQIDASRGAELSATYDCSFHEVSAAAGNYFEIIRAFQSLIRKSISILAQECESALQSRPSSSLKMSRMFGQMLAKMSKKGNKKKKKQKSWSI